jgi:hypothetical protein
VQTAHSDRTDDSTWFAGSDASARTEQDRCSVPPLGPDGPSRVLVARIFDAAIRSRWENGADWATNQNLAGRYCKITESVIRRWRNGEKAIPLAALHVLPAPLAEDLARDVLGARSVTLRRAMGSLREVVAKLDAPIAPSDCDEVLSGLLDAQRIIGERIAKLAREGR